jgi:alpha-tubulin suppressor-like RCC1 family protein
MKDMDWRKRLVRKMTTKRTPQNAGNAIAMVFMALGMAGVVTYGLNNIMRGPAVVAAETSRRTIAENNLVATTRLAITAAARQTTPDGSNDGDCDNDGFVEPMPFRTPPGGVPAPTGGGLLPMTMGASQSDPWGTQYGYCVWDPGTIRKSDAFAGCGGAGANRLEGAQRDDQPAIAVISAGKNGAFETTCADFIDDGAAPGSTAGDYKPDVPLVSKGANSDDIVLSYTYAEANGVGGGLWKLDPMSPGTAQIGMNIKSTSAQGATFDGKVELTNRGIVLPGDPGDDSVTGACDEAKDGQLRRNVSQSPPSIEMCDFTNGNGWLQVSGEGTPVVTDPVCYFSGYDNVYSGAGPSWFALSGSHFYGGGGGNDLFATVGTSNPASPPFNQLNNATYFDNSTAVVASGNYAYVPALSVNRLTVVDVSTPMAPVVAGSITDPLLANPDTSRPALSGSYVYIPSGSTNRLTIVDVSNTASPVIAGSVQDNTYLSDAYDVALKGGYAYVASGNYLTLVNISSPSTPAVYSHLNMPHQVYSVVIKGNFAYLGATYDAELYVVDISDPANPALVATLADNRLGDVAALLNVGRYLYAASPNYGDTPNAGVLIIDIGTPTAPAAVGFVQVDSVETMGVYGQYLYTGGLGMDVFDIGCDPLVGGGTAPTNPGVTPVAGGVRYLPDELDAGLVARWKMREEQGNTVVEDLVGLGSMSGSLNGALAYNASRIPGQDSDTAVSFDKIDDDRIVIPGMPQVGQQVTIAGWVNVSDVEIVAGIDGGTIFSMGDYIGLSETYDDEDGGATGLTLYYYTGSTWQVVLSQQNILSNGWHYVAATLDAVNDVFRLYLDGVVVAEDYFTDDISYSGLGDDTYFGAHGNSEDFGMSGAVDDFRVYDRALSPAEIAQLSKRSAIEGMNGPTIYGKPAGGNLSNRLSASQDYTCAIKDDGSLWCWGRDQNQQLGNGGTGSSDPARHFPVPVAEPTSQTYYLTGVNSDFSGGDFMKRLSPHLETLRTNTGAFTALSVKYGFGATPVGYPGVDDGPGKRSYSLTVSVAAPQPCISVSVDLRRINAAGTIQSIAGLGTVQQLTSTTTTFSDSIDLGTFTATDRITAAYVITETCNGAVAAFDMWGKLETPLINHAPWTSVTAGPNSACGVKGDGSAWCWGLDSSFQLGNSGFASGLYSEPSRVVDTGAPWVTLSTHSTHTCGIQSNGTLWCWGNDADGQLGNGAPASLQAQPAQVGTDTDWASVTNGLAFTCAIKTNGDAYCWGDDSYGQLGNGATTTTDQISPVAVSQQGRWAKLDAGDEHICGIKTDGSMWCWGHSTNKELGSPLGSNLTAPVKISSYADGWVDVSAGNAYVCGIYRDSNTYCWGDFSSGKIGNPYILNDRFVITMVAGSRNTAGISAGGNHTCMMKANGSLSCTGSDSFGQLGNGAGLLGNLNTAYPIAGFPSAQNWGWNEASTIIMAPYNFGVGLNGGVLGPDASGRGFGFTSAGRARLYEEGGDSAQLLIRADASNVGAQVSFKSAPTSALDITSGLVAKWLLDETTGTTAATSVGAFNGTLNGGPVWDTRGRIAGALTFDGADDYVQVSRRATLEPTSFTVAFWLKSAGAQSVDAAILNKTYQNGGAAPYFSYQFGMDGNQLWFDTGHTDSAQNSVASTDSLQPERWYYVVGTFANGGGSPNKRLYIDGALNASSHKNVAIRYDTAATGRLFMGSGTAAAPVRFKGSLDDVRIYNRALTAAEVTALYNYQISQNVTARTMGINYNTNEFGVGRNDAAASMFMPPVSQDMTISATGNVGIGASPSAKLDVGGAVRFGTDSTCDSNRAGAVRYTGSVPPWSYCNGTAWTNFPTPVALWVITKDGNATGQSTTCDIRADGSAWCWGAVSFGEVGDGQTTTSRLVPTQVHTDTGLPGWTDWRTISGGSGGACGIRADGSAWCWGYGFRGRHGNNSTSNQSRPVRVQTDTGPGGWNDWIAIDVKSHTCGIRANGTMWCWGGAGSGQLGNNSTAPDRSRPVQVRDDTGAGTWSDWKYVTAGNVTCGIRSNGTLWCWGRQFTGESGNNSASSTNLVPVQVHSDSSATGWTDWISVSASDQHTCGLRANGTAWCWGESANGRLGDNQATTDRLRPVQVQTDTGPGGWADWTAISAGWIHTCGIRTNGTMWCWGGSTHGQLGDNQTAANRMRPVQVHSDASSTGWSDWISVSAGLQHTCGTRSNGTKWCWGNAGSGRLGDNQSATNRLRPVQVSNP